MARLMLSSWETPLMMRYGLDIAPVPRTAIRRKHITTRPQTAVSLAPVSPESREGKYLTFKLGLEEYGIGILQVRDIIWLLPFTPVPRTPEFIKGIINLRGKVVPVVDLRLRLGLAPEGVHRAHLHRGGADIDRRGGDCPGHGGGRGQRGGQRQCRGREPTPSFGVSLDTAYILGLAKSAGQVRILLDIDRVLGEAEMAMLGSAAPAAPASDLMAAF